MKYVAMKVQMGSNNLLLFISTSIQDKHTNLNTAGKHTVTPPGSDFSVYTEIKGLAAARDMVI